MISLQTLKLSYQDLDQKIVEGTKFILSHFEGAHFPRTISTKTTDNKQIMVYSKEEAVARFKQANFLDCRINAFPRFTDLYEIPVDLVFIDLDLSNFKTVLGFRKALTTTLDNIKDKLDGNPTVLWTGNGYHIYQPIEGICLTKVEEFKEFNEVSKLFLRFASQYLSNGKCDPNNSPSLKSCLLRIPGSLNSKCTSDGIDPEVKIIQRWDGRRPNINLLLGNFYAYLVDQRQREVKEQRSQEKKYGSKTHSNQSRQQWIEILLQIPLGDFRKNAISLILTPYLVNIRKLGYEAAFAMVKDWSDKCNSLRRLDFDVDHRIKTSIKMAIKQRNLPMKFSTLKTKNVELYDIVSVKMQQPEATRGGIRNF